MIFIGFVFQRKLRHLIELETDNGNKLSELIDKQRNHTSR